MIKLNGTPVVPTIFPDGTSQVWNLPEGPAEPDRVEWIFEREEELIHLGQLSELVAWRSSVWIPYLPYGRQDKPVGNKSTFALSVFGRMLATLRIRDISTFDAHSNVIRHYAPNVKIVSANPLISQLAINYDCLIFPDEGASRRYESPIDVRIGHKVRDPQTGMISSYDLLGTPLPTNSKVLVVDDICDGGATFLLLAKALEHLDHKPDLYVSHGIFSKGVTELLRVYRNIFTTDSRPTRHEGVTVYESAPTHRLL